MFYDENDFTDPNCEELYPRIKVLAEKEAWRISKQSKGRLNLSVICPGLVLGNYILQKPTFTQIFMINMFKNPFKFNLNTSIVDVDDVAKGHIRCLTRPEISRGKRYLMIEGTYWYDDILAVIKEEFEPQGYSFCKIHLPDIVIRLLSYFSVYVKIISK